MMRDPPVVEKVVRHANMCWIDADVEPADVVLHRVRQRLCTMVCYLRAGGMQSSKSIMTAGHINVHVLNRPRRSLFTTISRTDGPAVIDRARLVAC